jgi:hypothetical protein
MRIITIPRLSWLLLAATLVSSRSLRAETWTLTSAPEDYWASVACSADGSTVVAVADKLLFVSTNFGGSWTSNGLFSPDQTVWSAAACSADGTKMVAGIDSTANGIAPGPLYTSTDAGQTWTSNGVFGWWKSFSSAANGTNVAGVAAIFTSRGGPRSGFYTSTNAGAEWMSNNTPDVFWKCITSSADGTKLAAVGIYSPIYLSTNAGNTLIPADSPGGYWSSISSSSDGGHLFAAMRVNYGGTIYRSTNSGAAWHLTSAPVRDWVSVVSSAAGDRVVAANADGSVHASTDSGDTWTDTGAPSPPLGWSCLACSADGCRVVALAAGGGVYTWQTTRHPALKSSISGDTLLLSWIIPSMPFVLQQSSRLDGSWADVLTTPVPDYSKLCYEVSVPKPAQTVFYRLASR